ncbi:hypothetical protein V8G54_024130 [Vigna mungo]|uniref:S-adenosylmethionine-dependent methyltransferase domain-containing protein n=1 Tax=Vigna mungo TaxID=3915 RepID=A0AAQ3RPU8_VIGMU
MNESDLKEMHSSTCPERTKIVENAIVYTISLKGQKTGFYADQRENRKFISTISDGLKVLDLCCYSGGFALNAVRGGALNVTGIDTSLLALELAKENVLLNSIDPGRISFLKEDATEFMKGALLRNESWDIVIIDPPKLAPTKKENLLRGSYAYGSVWNWEDSHFLLRYSGDYSLTQCQALVLAPTPELAQQIERLCGHLEIILVLRFMLVWEVPVSVKTNAFYLAVLMSWLVPLVVFGMLRRQSVQSRSHQDVYMMRCFSEVLHSASGMYRNLNSLAMQLTKRGGLLMTCSCSGAVTQSGIFLRILQGAASMAGRKITVLRQSGAACDHPIDPSYPEGAYLTNILLRVS